MKILYKAKRRDNGEWVEGLPSYGADGKITELECLKKIPGKEIPEIEYIEIDPDTLCQYIGLTDENRKKIFEGDIVNCFECECYGKIEWIEDDAGFQFAILLEDGCYEHEKLYDYVDAIEVIGNIFDNPEMLGSE